MTVIHEEWKNQPASKRLPLPGTRMALLLLLLVAAPLPPQRWHAQARPYSEHVSPLHRQRNVHFVSSLLKPGSPKSVFSIPSSFACQLLLLLLPFVLSLSLSKPKSLKKKILSSRGSAVGGGGSSRSFFCSCLSCSCLPL